MSPWFPLFSGPVPGAEARRTRVVNSTQGSVGFFVHFASSIFSISLDRSGWPCYNMPCCAGVAHLVERHLAKVEVAGSSPVARSIGRTAKAGRFFAKRPALGCPTKIPIYSEDAVASSFLPSGAAAETALPPPPEQERTRLGRQLQFSIECATMRALSGKKQRRRL